MTDNAKKWVEALRSGAYKQTTGRLRDKHGGYCCLGVACNLYIESHPGELGWSHGEYPAVVELAGIAPEEESLLPQTVRKWLGLSDESGLFVRQAGDYQVSLAELNDAGSTFAEIAAIIEQEPEGLFA